MKKIKEDPNYIVRLPVFLDATCSGIQHLAALIKDYELGSRVNLIPSSESDSVGDIYSDMLDPINEEINKYGKEKLGDFLKFKDIVLTRQIIKHSIMTKVYNVTNYGIEKQLESKLEKIEVDVKDDLQENKKSLKSVVIHDQVYLEALGKKSKITYFKVPAKNKKGYVLVTRKELFKIAEIINERVFFLFPSLKYIYDYLISISKLMIKLQIPLNWFTPNGIKVTQSYMKTEAKRVSIKLGQKSKVLVVRKTTDFVDTAKQAQAIIPNMIHSLDATHLINIINNASESKTLSAVPVISVHDCFGTLPNKMADLELLVKKEFINL